MNKTIFLILAVVSLSGGCVSVPEYTPYTPPEYAPDYKNRLTMFGSQSLTLRHRIFMLKSELDELYRNVDDSRDIAAITTNSLKEIKEQYSSLEATLQNGAHDCPTCLSETNFETYRQEMAQYGQSIADLEKRIGVLNERYAVDRKRYVLRKSKYREHLLKGLAANGIPEGHTYIDDKVLIYVDSIKVRKDTVTARLKAYLIMPRVHDSISTDRCDTIFAYNARGENLGSPIDVSSTKHQESGGVTVELTYLDNVSLGEGCVKLVLGKSVLNNESEVSMVIPYNLREITPPTLPGQTTQSPVVRTERDFVDRIETIACKKEGLHLVVPVTLDIHGKSVQIDMILDTGASVTIVPMKLYLKGTPKPLSQLRRQEFQTAERTIQCYIDEVQVSTSAYSKTSIIAISDYDTPLLGANYFEGIVFTVDVENECIYVYPRAG